MTATQLALVCDPDWTDLTPQRRHRGRRNRRLREQEEAELLAQGITADQLKRMHTIRLIGSYL
ncbi:hypothetical protein ACFWPQ_01960 [Streptomyces sp. NPDC058464]|uniref:hypothetical protein n=1 Tax=Streptomyces sp. NPDC058464 TaxID=3346511 RepID=UPI003652D1FC